MKKKFCIKRESYKINALTIKLQILLRYNNITIEIINLL